MRAYWLRILGAWLLLKLASNLVKDAEKHLKVTMSGDILAASDGQNLPVVDSTATPVPEAVTA
jgi:hypothetical protein